jgi:hypothetical protein
VSRLLRIRDQRGIVEINGIAAARVYVFRAETDGHSSRLPHRDVGREQLHGVPGLIDRQLVAPSGLAAVGATVRINASGQIDATGVGKRSGRCLEAHGDSRRRAGGLEDVDSEIYLVLTDSVVS